MSANWSFETRQIHAGQSPDPTTGAQALPIYQTNAYVFDNAEQAGGRFALSELGPIYTRITNPTQEVVENRIADLEGGVGALLLASGQAANTFAILNRAGAGDNIVASPSLYGGTYNFTVTTETLNDSVCTKSGSIIVNGAYAMPQIIKRGGGSSNQSVILGNALADYNFGWTVVPTISIEWEPSAPDGIVINEDDANQTIYFSGTPTVAGTYTYTLTAANYDSVATRKGSITVSSDNTGLSREEAEQGGISLSPNPMQECATLKITPKGNYQIELIHTTGQVVWQKTAASDGNTPIIIEKGNLKEGIYLLKINSNTDTQILKLIVK